MRCPKCGHMDDKVLDSRSTREGASVRRRRECLACSQRFTTYEEIVRDELRVVKRDGRREDLSRAKLTAGVLRACEKRPITQAQIEALVDSVLDEVSKTCDVEVSTNAIGEKVMIRLKNLDEVAYVRFASVYRRFADVNQFLNAIQDMVGKT
ncbi:MAG: transcriptional repressor NrdR [Lentisphaerae bacterium]|nr:transcriptional repressor NrdR [Lentisphaerota bacterium]